MDTVGTLKTTASTREAASTLSQYIRAMKDPPHALQAISNDLCLLILLLDESSIARLIAEVPEGDEGHEPTFLCFTLLILF
jgi:hypothetical protein